MEENKVEMADKIQILTRAISVAQITVESENAERTVRKTISSVDDVISYYKKFYAALTE